MKPTKLNLVSLEQRDVPATFGIPWQEASQLTLSFVPDGTLVGTQQSKLNHALSGNTETWQGEILRAFQTWAAQTNINIGLVEDDGTPLTAGGSVQGNAGFGDIRIAGVPLASDVFAVTAPPDMCSAWSGTILINTNMSLSIAGKYQGADLYTIMLQESGHALGVGNSISTSSAMYEYYTGVRTGLSAADITSIQSLYGVRTADQYDFASANDTRTTATNLPSTGAEAEITSTGDADWYRFTASNTSLVVKLDVSGTSLLNAIVRVTDANGNIIATGQSDSIFKNSVELKVSKLTEGGTYFVQVTSARTDSFGFGGYRLRAGTNSILDLQDKLEDISANIVASELLVNDSIDNANTLLNPEKTVSNTIDIVFSGRYNKSSDVDFFVIQAPELGTATTESLVVSVWGVRGADLDPTLQVYDANGNVLQHIVMNQTATNCVIQVTNITPGAKYFIRTASESGQKGTYRMAINFIDTTIQTADPFTGGLTNGTSKATNTFSLAQSSYIHLTLVSAGVPNTKATVRVTIYDSLNKVVATFISAPNDTQSLDLFLKAGTYRVEVTTTASDRVGFALGLSVTTDPVGLLPTSPSIPTTHTPSPPRRPSTWWSLPSPSYTSSPSSTSTTPAY